MHMELINNTFIPEKRYHVAAGLPEGKHSCKLSETCLPAGIISGDSWILTVSTRSAGARPTSTNPHGETDRIILSYQNPIAILRDDYRSNRSNLLNNGKRPAWTVSRWNWSEWVVCLFRIRTDILSKLWTALKRKSNNCRNMKDVPIWAMKAASGNIQVHSFFSFDRKFGGLPPDEICGMLQQNGLSESNLPYQITKESSRAVKQSCTNWQPERTGRNTSNRQIRWNWMRECQESQWI